MNKIFFRYIARSFWGPFLFGLAVFIALLLFGTLFDRVNFFMKSTAGFGVFLLYLLYQIPYFAVKIIPIASLLAVLFALGAMISKGEWKAGMAGGWRPANMVAPLLFCSALAGVLQFVLQEAVAPPLFMKSEYLFEGKLRGRTDWKRQIRKDVSFLGGPDIFVTAQLFDGAKSEMQNVLVNIYQSGRLAMELNAKSAVWDNASRGWHFFDGVSVKYDLTGSSLPASEAFQTYSGPEIAAPKNIIIDRLVPDGVNTKALARRVRRLEAMGAPAAAEKVQYYSKLAAPFACLALSLTGLALVLLVPMSRVLGFAIALGTGFFFWVVVTMGQYAGEAEMVSPVIAAFAPAAVFAAVSLLALRKV